MAPQGEPTRTKTHDFVDKELGRAVPYGVYDLANDEGWVSVGDTADTASIPLTVPNILALFDDGIALIWVPLPRSLCHGKRPLPSGADLAHDPR